MQPGKKYALITGGTSGIGYELTKLFARDGYGIILVARGQDALDRTAEELRANGVEVLTFSKDLFNAGNAIELVQEIREKAPPVDVLVNDAGQGLYGEFVKTELYRNLDIIQLNISSLVVLTHAFLKDMIERGEGKILNLASIAGKVPGPFQAVYHGTKAFVHSFTEAIRNEVKDTGVTVTSLLPGETDTDFFHKADMLDAKNVQAGNLADPAKVAQDGFEALMSGKDMVVSGIRNKAQVAMSSVLPDSVVAGQVHMQQEPAHSDQE
jgi:uncharacterized protein